MGINLGFVMARIERHVRFRDRRTRRFFVIFDYSQAVLERLEIATGNEEFASSTKFLWNAFLVKRVILVSRAPFTRTSTSFVNQVGNSECAKVPFSMFKLHYVCRLVSE